MLGPEMSLRMMDGAGAAVGSSASKLLGDLLLPIDRPSLRCLLSSRAQSHGVGDARWLLTCLVLVAERWTNGFGCYCRWKHG